MTSLNSLILYGNQLTSFDGSGLTVLDYIDLGNNGITSLNGFIFPSSLTLLYLYENQLTSVNLTNLNNLIELDLQGNQLTSLNISNLTNLTNLYLTNNPILPQNWDSILSNLVSFGNESGNLSIGEGQQRTSRSDNNYTTLVDSLFWSVDGTFEIVVLPIGRKLRVKGIGQINNI
jgi:Leucine-rich repeat (LRR) protein